jgi:hypothetical protein
VSEEVKAREKDSKGENPPKYNSGSIYLNGENQRTRVLKSVGKLGPG